MENKLRCQYCGKEISLDDRDYDMGAFLAEFECFEALGYVEDYISSHVICKECSEEIKENMW